MIYTDFTVADLKKVFATKDQNAITAYLTKYNLEVVDGVVKPLTIAKDAWQDTAEYFDKRQLVRKILLNSALN